MDTQKLLDEQRENEKNEIVAILKEWTEPRVNENNEVTGKTAEEIAEMIMAVGSMPTNDENDPRE